MKKTRLNESHRNELKSLARKLVIASVDRTEVDSAHGIAMRLVRQAIEKVLPQNDMRILEKYEMAHDQNTIYVVGENSNVFYKHFEFADGEAPISISGRRFLVNEKTQEAIVNYEKVFADYNDEIRRRRDDYHVLISTSRYFEDLVEIWPEAASISLAPPVPTIYSPDLIQRIKDDVARRQMTGVTVADPV